MCVASFPPQYSHNAAVTITMHSDKTTTVGGGGGGCVYSTRAFTGSLPLPPFAGYIRDMIEKIPRCCTVLAPLLAPGTFKNSYGGPLCSHTAEYPYIQLFAQFVISP